MNFFPSYIENRKESKSRIYESRECREIYNINIYIYVGVIRGNEGSRGEKWKRKIGIKGGSSRRFRFPFICSTFLFLSFSLILSISILLGS